MKPIVIANWKMRLGPQAEIELAKDFKKQFKKIQPVEAVVAPSFLSLTKIAETLKKSDLKIGAQDVFWREDGSFTGEVSPKFLKESGCQYVIVGHSERRENLGETDEMVNSKVEACLESGLTPIICVGETLAERRRDKTDHRIYSQLKKGLAGIHLIPKEKLVIAYEPVWSIGTGHIVALEQAEHVYKIIRQFTMDAWPKTIARNNIRIIYGGSVDGDNAAGLTNEDLFDGFLVGTASLTADEFQNIINALKEK